MSVVIILFFVLTAEIAELFRKGSSGLYVSLLIIYFFSFSLRQLSVFAFNF